MSEGPDIADPNERMLARLAELDLAAAERAHARLMAAGEETFDQAGRTYQRMARSLRQTLALNAKLKRERAQAPAPAPAKPGGAAIARRIGELRQAVTRVIWDEAEDAEAADWHLDSLEDLVVQEMLRDTFVAETLDDHVARVCLALGLAPERIARWRELPDPPPREDEPQAEPPGESSA